MEREPLTGTPADAAETPEIPFTPTHTSARQDGWTAERQQSFITALAETGCISEACHQAGITARSAYRLRSHPQGAAFALAWDLALRSAAAKLLTIAYERAVRGSVRQLWRDNKLVGEVRQPSDRLLTFLLGNLAPWNNEETTRWARLTKTARDAGRSLPAVTDKLTDSPIPADLLGWDDYRPDPRLNAIDFDAQEEEGWDA